MYAAGELSLLAAPYEDARVVLTVEKYSPLQTLPAEDGWRTVDLDGELCYVPVSALTDCLPGTGHVVAIDPGHSGKCDTVTKEPIGPGASEMKMKDSGGTSGTTTGLAEYELNLMISFLLRDELESRGYTVVMTRTDNEVSLGNIDRATVANDAEADAFIRVHANGSLDPAASGALTICQTAGNPYNGALHDASYALSTCVLDELSASTGCKKLYVWETDTMAGINWSQVPVTIVEVGFMTNPDEDRLLSTDGYQQLVAEGIANGIDAFVSLP